MALVLLPALRHARIRLHPVFDWRHPAVRKMLRLSGWTIGYVVTNQIALLFVLVLAKSGTTGNVSAYLYAYAFFQVPHGLLAVSIMTTMMPELSRSAAQRDFTALAYRFRVGLRYLLLLMMPAAVLFIALAQPMLGVLVRGGFGPHDAAVTADTLQALAIGLVPFSIYLYSLRGFYVLHDTRTPFWINAIENGINIALAIVLFPSLGVQGLALAWAGAYTVAAIITLVVLGRRVPHPVDRLVRASAVRAAIGAARARDRCRTARGRDRPHDRQPGAPRHGRGGRRRHRRLRRHAGGAAHTGARIARRGAQATNAHRRTLTANPRGMTARPRGPDRQLRARV